MGGEGTRLPPKKASRRLPTLPVAEASPWERASRLCIRLCSGARSAFRGLPLALLVELPYGWGVAKPVNR